MGNSDLLRERAPKPLPIIFTKIPLRNRDIFEMQLFLLMVYPREVLNRLRWTEGESISDATIWYVHRGVPGDVKKITGAAIVSLGKGFFDTEEAMIPYHRILRIDYKGETLFEKDSRARTLN